MMTGACMCLHDEVILENMDVIIVAIAPHLPYNMLIHELKRYLLAYF